MAARLVYSLLTLYMIAILLRWFGPWLGLELESGRWAWICRLTDPLIQKLRTALPAPGPFDFGPVASLLLVWLIREISVALMVGA